MSYWHAGPVLFGRLRSFNRCVWVSAGATGVQQCGKHGIELFTGMYQGVLEAGLFVQYLGTSAVRQGRSAGHLVAP